MGSTGSIQRAAQPRASRSPVSNHAAPTTRSHPHRSTPSPATRLGPGTRAAPRPRPQHALGRLDALLWDAVQLELPGLGASAVGKPPRQSRRRSPMPRAAAEVFHAAGVVRPFSSSDRSLSHLTHDYRRGQMPRCRETTRQGADRARRRTAHRRSRRGRRLAAADRGTGRAGETTPRSTTTSATRTRSSGPSSSTASCDSVNAVLASSPNAAPPTFVGGSEPDPRGAGRASFLTAIA